jgi:hypothetical protein
MGMQKDDQNFQAANKLYDQKNAEKTAKQGHANNMAMQKQKGNDAVRLAKAKPKPGGKK